jgi:hypothetical protein
MVINGWNVERIMMDMDTDSILAAGHRSSACASCIILPAPLCFMHDDGMNE